MRMICLDISVVAVQRFVFTGACLEVDEALPSVKINGSQGSSSTLRAQARPDCTSSSAEVRLLVVGVRNGREEGELCDGRAIVR